MYVYPNASQQFQFPPAVLDSNTGFPPSLQNPQTTIGAAQGAAGAQALSPELLAQMQQSPFDPALQAQGLTAIMSQVVGAFVQVIQALVGVISDLAGKITGGATGSQTAALAADPAMASALGASSGSSMATDAASAEAGTTADPAAAALASGTESSGMSDLLGSIFGGSSTSGSASTAPSIEDLTMSLTGSASTSSTTDGPSASSILDNVSNLFSLATTAPKVLGQAYDLVKSGLGEVWKGGTKAYDFAKTGFGYVKDALDGIFGGASKSGGIWNTIKNVAGEVIDLIPGGGLFKKAGKLLGKIF